MNTRTILIHNYAKKNKSRKSKYFVLSICENYSNPRLDYFSSQEKWTQKKYEVCNNSSVNVSHRSIDLSKLFFIDDIHRSKLKETGLDLYMEDGHLMLTLNTKDIKKKWKEYLENIIYKNSKLKSYCKIEHVLEVSIRLKPKENIDKSIYSQMQGRFRACFTKSFLMFVNVSLEKPAFTIQYPFIRQWESRFDGTFRLEIGRAALIGECILILQLADYEDSKTAHSMLSNCITSFKLSRPEPPKVRNPSEKSTKRMSLVSCYSKPISSSGNSDIISKRHESCIPFGTDFNLEKGSKANICATLDNADSAEDSNYLPMNGCPRVSPKKSNNVLNYFEHINRIYKCPVCGCFTKLIIYCSRCCNTVHLNSLSLLCKIDNDSESNSFDLHWQLLEPTRSKAQSLTEKSNRLSSCTYKTKQFLSNPSKPSVSSKSSSKTSTNEASNSSKQESQTSLPISANRHDDDIFMELDFNNLDSRISSNIKTPTISKQQSQLKCANCLVNLNHKIPNEKLYNRRCSTCFEELVTLSVPIKDTVIGSEWRPRTTSLFSARPLRHAAEFNRNFQSEYVDVRAGDNNRVEAN